MKKRFVTAVIVLFSLGLAAQRAIAQANVNENESNYLYVNGSSGSDSNSGSQSSPLRTIGAAVSKALNANYSGVGSRIIVSSGSYRETVSVSPNPSRLTSAAITIQAAITGGVIINGADVLSNPYNGTGNSSIYTYGWNYTTSACSVPSGWPGNLPAIGYRRETVFVNGVLLTQVMSQGDMRPGTFYLNTGTKQLQVWPSSGTNMSAAVVETGARAQTLMANHVKNMVFRGLNFAHAATCVNQSGAQVYNSNNVLFDQVQANSNSWGGLGVSTSSNVTVQNSVASHNGGEGFGTFQDTNILYQFNEADANGWRASLADLYDFAMGGLKGMSLRNATVNQLYAYNNQGQGLWFDTDNENISVNGAVLVNSTKANVQLEANEGPIKVQNSYICGGDVGVNLLTSEGITLTGNKFYNNGNSKYPGEIYLAGQPGGRTITNYQTHQSIRLFTTGMTVTGNVVEDATPGQYVFGTYMSGSDWSKFVSTLHSNNNQWYDVVQATAFTASASNHVTLSGWSGSTGQDTGSWWASSGAPSQCNAPYSSDFKLEDQQQTFKPYYVARGSSVTINLKTVSFDGGAVSLSMGNMPSGLSASLSTSSIASGKFTLTINASNSAGSATVPVTIFGQKGNQVHAITFEVSI